MRAIRWMAAAGAIVVCAGGVTAVDIVVNGTTEYQTIDGFGTSVMNWMSSVYGNAALRTDYARDLGCSVVRGELHPMAITKNACMNLNPTTFGPNIDANVALMDFNQSRVSITGGFMQAVYSQRLDEMKVMLSIWTPPDWMKENTNFGDPGCQSYGGHLIRTHENRTNFARYVAAWIKGFSQRYQVPVYCLSVQNELDWAHDPSTYTTSCQYFNTWYPSGAERTNNGPPLGVNDYNPAVRYIYNELRANNIPTLLFGPEKSHIFQNIDNLSFHMGYIKDMIADTTIRLIDGFCHHGYALTPGNRSIIAAYWNGRTDANPNRAWPGIGTLGKPSWQTEAGGHAVSWDGAMQLARCIQDELIAGNLSCYLHWSYASDGSDDRHSLIINTTTRTDKYYAFKHFSRYIRPGAKRLACSPDDPAGLSVSAFRHNANGTLTIVMINAGGAQTANITLPASPSGITQFQVFTTTSSARWVESTAQVSGGRVTVSVPASSWVTLYGQGQTPIHRQGADTGRRTEIRTARPSVLTLVRRHDGMASGVVVNNAAGSSIYRDLRGRRLWRGAM